VSPAYRYTLLELAAILLGALLLNVALARHDVAQVIEDTRHAEQFVGPFMSCDVAPEREECEQ
jgi:hypothetical protein